MNSICHFWQIMFMFRWLSKKIVIEENCFDHGVEIIMSFCSNALDWLCIHDNLTACSEILIWSYELKIVKYILTLFSFKVRRTSCYPPAFEFWTAAEVVNDVVKGTKIQISLMSVFWKSRLKNWRLFLHHCQLQLKFLSISKFVRYTFLRTLVTVSRN